MIYQEITRTYQKLEDRVQTLLYRPLHPSKKSQTAVVLMYSGSDYFEFPPATALSERGYTVLAANTNPRSECLDAKIEDLRITMQYIKNYPGIRNIVLIGHSGGATLATAYQCIAENGPSIFRRPDMIVSLGEIGDAPAADGMLLLDPNFGNAIMTLLSLDPSIIDEKDPRNRDCSLDIFNPSLGYNPTGACEYDDVFIHRYLRGQAARMNRLIKTAQDLINQYSNGEGIFTDAAPMIIPGASQVAFNNRLFPQMLSIFSHTAEAWPLIHKDGSVTKQIVPCVREVRGASKTVDSLSRGAIQTNAPTFLKTVAIRATEDLYYDETTLYGVEWTSSYSSSVGNGSMIKAPMLLMGMTGSYEYITAEHIYRMNKVCSDKSIAFVEGASHNFIPNIAAESYAGEFGDTVKS